MKIIVNIPPIPNDFEKGVKDAQEQAKKQNKGQDFDNNDSAKKKIKGPDKVNFEKQQAVQETLSDKISPFTGAYYNDRLVLTYGNTTYEFPGDPLVKPRLNKRIVETEVVNGNIVIDTVTEIIGNGQYELTIEGELKGENGLYPQDDLQTLNRVCQLGYSWKVSSRWLADLGITNLIIHTFEPQQPEGLPDTIYYTLTAKQDRPAELLTGALGFT